MASFSVERPPGGVITTIKGDRFDVLDIGTLEIRREGEPIAYFAPGHWLSVTLDEPDLFTEATAAASIA